MSDYEKAVLAAIAKGPEYVGWYTIERRLSMVSLPVVGKLQTALEHLLKAGFIEESVSDPETYRTTSSGLGAL
jgi:hypothetical protein